MKKVKNNPGLIQNLLVLNDKKECKDGEGGKRASRRELILGYVSRPILGYLLLKRVHVGTAVLQMYFVITR